MSSKGKRTSILKKQTFVPDNVDATATATSTSTVKGSRKIEFNKKKSIKEFIVGEDTDTIWGNSYEVSTDGTPSSALGDVTLGNSTRRSSADEQNKENRVQLNLSTPRVDPSPNSSDGSWDLSVTLADDERRRIRGETSVMFSQSLNTTDRLFVEPFPLSEPKIMPRQSNLAMQCNDVRTVDIVVTVSPRKSPQKMMCSNPKEKLCVKINDVPQSTDPAADGSSQREGDACATGQRILFQTPTRATLRGNVSEATSQTTLRGTSFNVSETWNSHPQAMINQLKLQQTNLDDLTNMSSDVDTTLAITNTVAKLLESGPNLTIPAPTTMELDESTTTEHLPTNALARARPSFLPSQRAVDESSNVPLTPPIDGSDAKSLLPPETFGDTQRLDISSPVEGCFPLENMSMENVSLVDDFNQRTIEEAIQKSTISNGNGNKSSSSNATAASRHGFSIDFGISSLSLKLAANSPETPAVNRPKILRPTLPLTMFDGTDGGKAGETPRRDLMSREVEKPPVHRTGKKENLIETRQTIHVAEDMETSFQNDNGAPRAAESNGGSEPVDTTYFDHPRHGESAPISLTVAMEDAMTHKQSYRPTVHEAKAIVVESATSPNGSVRRHRTTVTCPERMEIMHDQAEPTAAAKPPGNGKSIFDSNPMRDQSMEMEQTVKRWWDKQKQGSVRGTIHEKISIDEATAVDGQCSRRTPERQQKQQLARRTYYPDESMKVDTDAVQSAVTTKETPVRKTFYPEETMKVDRVAVQQLSAMNVDHPARKTIVCNESMVLDVCTDTDEGIDTETSMSCRLYGRNINELSIHATGGRNVIDMTISRPTTFNVERKNPSVGETLMAMDDTNVQPDDEDVLACRRLTTRAVRDMDEDNARDVGEMQTTVNVPRGKASALGMAAEDKCDEKEDSSGKRRFTTHNAEIMDETNTINSMSAPLQTTHNDGQGLTKGNNSNEEPPVRSLGQRSERKQRFTTNEMEEMDASKIDSPAPAAFVAGNHRRSIYKREDMDATEIVHRRAEVFGSEENLHSSGQVELERRSTNDPADMDATKGTERSRRSRIHSDGQIKTRFTSHGNKNMDDISCFNHTPPLNALRQEHLGVYGNKSEPLQQSQLSIYQTMALRETLVEDQFNRSEFTAQPADITNYNAFLANHEKSHGAEKHSKQRLTTYYMEGMHEAGLDSTRLSREREQIAAERVLKSRPSTYSVEAMDETNVAADHQVAPSLERESTAPKQKSVHVPSPVAGQQDDRSVPPRRSERLQQSMYMESTLPVVHGPQVAKRSVEARPSECSTTSRRSQLRNIVQHTAIEDMEGFSLLADDEDVSQLKSKQLDRMETLREEGHQPRGTVFCTALDVDGPDHVAKTERQFAPKYRPTICQVEAMMEDTVSINVLGYGKASESMPHEFVDQAVMPSSVSDPQRKSSVCMEETMLPIAVRIERRKSAFEKSPILCLAEHPPPFQHYSRSDETVAAGGTQYNEERTRDRDGNSRQTMNQASRMDMTLGPRESMVRAVVGEAEIEHAPNRRTIYHSKAMEQTPPHAGRSSRGEPFASLDKTVETAADTAIHEVEKKTEKSTRVMRKPRQTILIPLDMEVDAEAELREASPSADVKEEEPSLLVRESTEDCVLRNVQSMATKVLFNGRATASGFGNLFREPSVDGQRSAIQLSETLGGKGSDEPGRGYTSSQFVRPTSTVHELSDISMCNSTMRPELPQIGNITGMMSLREITEPLPPAPLLPEQNNSVSVICRVDQQPDTGSVSVEEQKVFERTETHAQPSLAFASLATQNVAEIASEDEFYDADDFAAVEQMDPLSLTKSRHLTMKFIDVEHLERTRNHRASVVVPSTTSKRGHAQLLCSPALSRVPPVEDDPLHVTTLPPHQPGLTIVNEQQTPRGPMMKRLRTSSSPEYRGGGQVSPCDFETQPVAVEEVKEEILVKQEEHQHSTVVQEQEPVKEVLVKEEELSTTLARVGSQTLIHDPSVFVLDEEDGLLDDESNPPCASYSEEILPEPKKEERTTRPGTPDGTSFDRGGAGATLPVEKLKELSFYRDFANLTIDNLDSWDEAKMDDADGGRTGGQQGIQCISLSDEDSLSITPPKRTLAAGMPGALGGVFHLKVRPSSAEVLDSTIASEVMYELRQKHPPAQSACCGTNADECLCRTKRALERRKETIDVVWAQYTTWFAAFEEQMSHMSHRPQRHDGEEQQPRTFEEVFEELNWRLLRTRLDESSFGPDEMNNSAERGRDQLPVAGQFPEVPSAVFLCENLQSFLSEQMLVDTSPSPGAPLPAIPRITQLIANKLSFASGTRWQLDCSKESEGVLVLRHRTLRSVVIAVQLQQDWEKNGSKRKGGGKEEDRRLERIQVRECQQEYVHTPKLLLAHIEFMRLAKATTERTLRSTYRTVASLMGLWQRFNELLLRVFDSINRLLTITRNNDALLCYDADMERFFVKKYFHRCLDDGILETNMLTVHFNWIGSMCASGVNFKRPIVEAQKLLPGTGKGRLEQGGTGSNDDQTGLMFLECLLWNVTNQFES